VFKHKLIAVALAAAATLPFPPARAQVIVNDPGNLVQNLQQALNTLTQIENQITQIEQMQLQYQSMTGSRGMGSLFRNPAYDNYVPLDANALIQNVTNQGLAGLSPAARALRDASMTYQCEGLRGEAFQACQVQLAQPYQAKALWMQALSSANGRMNQIQSLMGAINTNKDPMAIAELEARINAENALIAHERSRADLLRELVAAEREVMQAQLRARNLQMLNRPIRAPADH
jgi:type IV secretion system protein VirB5